MLEDQTKDAFYYKLKVDSKIQLDAVVCSGQNKLTNQTQSRT